MQSRTFSGFSIVRSMHEKGFYEMRLTMEFSAGAKKIKTFLKKLAIFLKKLAGFFENDLIFLRNTLVFEHVVFIYVRISLYNCIGLWICTYVKECVLLDERNTCSLHFYVFTGDSHFRFGFRIC